MADGTQAPATATIPLMDPPQYVRTGLPPSISHLSYLDVNAALLARPPVPYSRITCDIPVCDNTARRRFAGVTILPDPTRWAYGHWMRTLLANQ